MSAGRFNLSALAVRERSVTLFLIILIAVAGLVAFFGLGRAEDPPFTVKQMTVITVWPGATAQEMQDQVAEPLEKRLQELKWYDRTETYTRPGMALITLSLQDQTPPSEVPEQFYQARKKLGDEAKNLPAGVSGPMMNDEFADVTFALFALKARGEPPRQLVRDAEALRQQLLHVPGVAAAVPLTLAVVFVVMAATGKNFDRITLGSLILALGLLVDDAIIAIEMMVVKMEEGYDRLKASAYAWSHTAAPMLAGTLVTAVGFMPNGFAQSTAGEYASNVFWIVGIALIASWMVAVIFTPWLGVHLLPDRKPAAAGHAALYDTPRYQRFRRLLTRVIAHKWRVAAGVVALFIVAILGMSVVKKQFFPTSDRPEVLVEVQLPYGSSISQTSAAAAKIEHWLQRQPEAKIVTSYIGQGAPRFYLAMAPELPDPSFAKLVVLTDGQGAREALKRRLREAVANGLAPEARVRVTQLVFGPYSPYPVAWRVMGPDPHALLDIAERVKSVLQASPLMRTVNTDWGSRVPVMHFSLNQDRLQASGLSSQSVAQQLQFLLSGIPITTVREDIRAVQVIGRAAGDIRLDPAKIADFTLVGSGGQRVPLSQIGDVSIRMEDPLLRRRDRTPTITVRGDVAENLQPPDVSTALMKPLQPIIDSLPPGYRIETAGSIEESGKATRAMVPLFPIMIALTLLIIILQVRSLSAMVMVFLTAPLGLIGVVPTLLLFNQPFGINALVGLIALSGILMRNTLILIGQIHHNQQAGLDPFHAVVEATVQRARPVLLTALAAILAFIPLTHSVFWGTLAYTLIGGTLGGTIMTLIFLPAMYAIWFRIRPENTVQQTELHLQR